MPSISVIICTYNRADYLSGTLGSLSNQSAQSDTFEVLIIDNNSSDSTYHVSQMFESLNPWINIRYFLEKTQGLSHARNRGVKEAKTEILTFIDDDVLLPNNFVDEIIKSFRGTTAIAIGGKVLPYYESGKAPRWMSHFLLPTVSALDMGSRRKLFKGSKFPIGANMSFKNSAFEKYGMFNTELGRSGGELQGGEEKDLFNRLKSANEKIVYSPQVCLQHVIPEERLKEEYIKGLAIGVGTSEWKRLSKKGKWSIFKKWISEFVKLGGTVILFLVYSLQFKFAAAWMLVKFRFWVLKGMIT